jgi:hypothetical protein
MVIRGQKLQNRVYRFKERFKLPSLSDLDRSKLLTKLERGKVRFTQEDIPDKYSLEIIEALAGEMIFFRGDVPHFNLSYEHHCAVIHGDVVFPASEYVYDGSGTDTLPATFHSYIDGMGKADSIVERPNNYDEDMIATRKFDDINYQL